MCVDELGLDDQMGFGKYRSDTVEDVLEVDPQYLQWVVDTDAAEFDEEVIQLIEQTRE